MSDITGGEPIGEAKVRVRPDAGGFREELDADLDKDMAGTDRTVHIDADTTKLDTKTMSAREKLLAFGPQGPPPELNIDDRPTLIKLSDVRDRVDELYIKLDDPKQIKVDTGVGQARIDEIKVALDELNARVWDAHIEAAGVDEAKAKIDELSAKANELGRKTETVKVKVDASETQRTVIPALQAQLADISKRANIPISLDDKTAVAKLSALQAQMSSVRQRLGDASTMGFGDDPFVSKLSADLAKLDVNVERTAADLTGLKSEAGSAGGGMDGLATKTRDAASSFGGGAGGGAAGGSGLIGAALALSPALVTIGAVGVAGLGAVAGAAGAAATGLGAFAAVAKPLWSSVNTAAGDQLKYNNAVASYGAASSQAHRAAATLGTDMANLSPAEQGAAAQLGNFKQSYQDWVQSFDPQILPVFTGGLSLLRAGMADAAPLVRSTAGALSTLEQQATSALGSPYWRNFFNLLAGQGNQAITTFGHVIGGALTALAGLDRAFSPLIVSVEGGLNHLAERMTAFGQQSAHTGINSFIDYVRQNGPLVGHTLEDLGRTFSTLVQDAAPLGPGLLTVADGVLKMINPIIAANPLLVELAAGLFGVNRLVGPLVGGLPGLKAAFGGLKTGELAGNLSGVEKAMGRVGVAASGLIAPIRAAEGVSASFMAALPVAAAALPVIAAVGGIITVFKLEADAAAKAKAAGQSYAQGYVQQATQLGQSNQQINSSLQSQINSLKAHEAQLRSSGKQYQVWGGIIQTHWNTDNYRKLAAEEANLQKQLDARKSSEAGVAAATANQAGLTGRGVSPTDQLTAAQNKLSGAQQNLTQKTTEVSTAIDTMVNKFLNADNANIAFGNNLASLATTLKGATSSLTAQTSATNRVQTAQMAASNASQNLTAAQGRLTAAQASGTATPAALAAAHNAVIAAQQRQAATSLSLTQAQQSQATMARTNTFLWNDQTHTFDENTAAGRQAETSLNAVSGSIQKQIDAMLKQGDTTAQINGVLQDHENQLVSVAGQYGLTSDQVKSYLGQMGLLPGQVGNTLGSLNDATNAVNTQAGAVANLKSQLDAMAAAWQQAAPGVRQFGSNVSGAVSGLFGFASGGIIAGATGMTIPHSAAAAGMVANSATYLIGEGNPRYKEYLVATDPQYRDRSMALTGALLNDLGARRMASGGTVPPSPTTSAAGFTAAAQLSVKPTQVTYSPQIVVAGAGTLTDGQLAQLHGILDSHGRALVGQLTDAHLAGVGG